MEYCVSAVGVHHLRGREGRVGTWRRLWGVALVRFASLAREGGGREGWKCGQEAGRRQAALGPSCGNQIAGTVKIYTTTARTATRLSEPAWLGIEVQAFSQSLTVSARWAISGLVSEHVDRALREHVEPVSHESPSMVARFLALRAGWKRARTGAGHSGRRR